MGEPAQTERMINEREIALKLHALDRREQRRLLKQVPVEERSILKDLLRELEQLGIPKSVVESFGHAEPQQHESAAGKRTDGDKVYLPASLKYEPPVVRMLVEQVIEDCDSDSGAICDTLGITSAVHEYLRTTVMGSVSPSELSDE